MEPHSKLLENTKLWDAYLSKQPAEERTAWVRQVYDASVAYLKDVRLTFQNYTLHDETHVLNVLDAMAGILGNQIDHLTAGEAELLILAACLHDLGMVYAGDETKRCFGDKKRTGEFLRTHCPELLGCPAEDWPGDIRQWYLRSLHPFRLSEVLQVKSWKELFSAIPGEVVPKRCILAVCEAHGEAPEEFLQKPDLEYLDASDIDPLFCTLLLRLADLLDFDDTRAPKILYSYVECNEQSRIEWDKHRASGGFHFPDAPSTASLPYKARCTNPGIEHAIRDFLDGIDSELNTCVKLQKKCHSDWQRSFPFPRSVSCKEIESDGYVSGDFLMTMDQARIMELLTGEQLYDRDDVFIRELLQNSIDATLLRVELDRKFSLKDARIDLWEWSDKDGNIWFRIDDMGTGMTEGMLQRYFLKIGNSYYTSQELRRDLQDHGQTDGYRSISRFGIGFLSCFLCGTFAEVSTLYFDPQKNMEESGPIPSHRVLNYGLRMQVTGLKGYYTLKSQSQRHQPDGSMPAPDDYFDKVPADWERDGYRAQPGTSISVKLDPGRLGSVNLRETVEEFLCCAKVPVYYNGERIGRTYDETMDAVRNLEGETCYGLPPEWREKFDQYFPDCSGQYPQIIVTVIPLDKKENRILPELSGVFIKYDVRFKGTPTWQAVDRHYRVDAILSAENTQLHLRTQNTDFYDAHLDWDYFIAGHSQQEVKNLETALKALPRAPLSPDELGKAWIPFATDQVSPSTAWQMWTDYRQMRNLFIPLKDLGIPIVDTLTGGRNRSELSCSYHGVISGNIYTYSPGIHPVSYSLLLLLDGRLRPTVKASRSIISNMPTELFIAIHGMQYAWSENFEGTLRIPDWSTPLLPSWRELRDTNLWNWLQDNLQDYWKCKMEELDRPLYSECEASLSIGASFWSGSDDILWAFYMAYLQDTFQMTVNYEAGQVITVTNRASDAPAERYELFPPMMFCDAATEQSRRILCSKAGNLRRCITADHPYTVWLLKNAATLNQYYNRQFQQIVNALRNSDSDHIINTCNGVREQLASLPEHHGVDIKACPQLSEADFWLPESESKNALD